MRLLEIIIKSAIILGTVLLMLSPLFMERLVFKLDEKRKISYKRFRLVVFTWIYVLVVTVAMVILKDLVAKVETLSMVKWVAKKLALDPQQQYFISFFAAVVINFLIGVLHGVLSLFVRIGMKKKDLVNPDPDGEFTPAQKRGRKIVSFFRKESWFFVGKVLQFLAIALTVFYALAFIVYQIPALFDAKWIPYSFISMMFEAGYVYPMLTLLALWQMYFFLSGMERLEDTCPEFQQEPEAQYTVSKEDLLAIDEEVRKQFGNFYACDVDISDMVQGETSPGDHDPITRYIGQAVENDKRNPQLCKEVYLDCIDKLVASEKSLLINGSFYSEFSAYFMRYLSMVVARGDNIVMVCNSEAQIHGVHEYLTKGMTEISSLYCKNFRQDAVDYDNPIWRIAKVSGEECNRSDAAMEESNILVTSLDFLCSERFEKEYNDFVSRIDMVVFVDTQTAVNSYADQMSVLNARLKHITKRNAVQVGNKKVTQMHRLRYLSRKIRYVCFADNRVAGMGRALENMLSVDFESVDAMKFNPQTIVRCYNYEARADDLGRRECKQFINSTEEVGPMMNIAILCLAKGASNVTLFLDDAVPYQKIAETIASNSGQITLKVDGQRIRINKSMFNPDGYSVVIAMDSDNNLPTTLKKYTAMMPDKPALLLLFSKPYMMRDFYTGHADKLWTISQIGRIPVEEGTKRDAAQKILVKANFGGISKREILSIVDNIPQFEPYVQADDLDGILRLVLEIYGEPVANKSNLFRYFEYSVSKTFDTQGQFRADEIITLRRQGRVFEAINGRNMVRMHTPMGEVTLPIPRSRVTQNFIAEQNLIYNGEVYYIRKVDPEGHVYAQLAVGDDKKLVYQYLQDREYRVRIGEMEKVSPTRHVVIDRTMDDVQVKDAFLTVFRAPTEVLTHGYYEISPYTLALYGDHNLYHNISDPGNDELAVQCYRRYGNIQDQAYSSDHIFKSGEHINYANGALMMGLRFCGKFGQDVNKTAALAATMLNELLHDMFPAVKDALVVCPVIDPSFNDPNGIMDKQPKIKLMGSSDAFPKGDFTLMIIEDCAEDLGVISALMSAGNDIMRTLFEPVYEYLSWYLGTDKKSEYLSFGLPEEPECFDFTSLHKLAAVVGDKQNDLHFVDIEALIEWDSCDFCGKRYPKNEGVVELEDGRKMCRHCAQNLVGNNKKVLKAHLDRAKRFLENTYGITLDDDYEVCFESTVKTVNALKRNRDLIGRGSDIPLKTYIDDKKRIHVEYSLPSANLSELLVRELTYVWQLSHLPQIAEDLAEGHIALVGIQYLRFLNESTLSVARTNYYESATTVAGEGYRKLVRQLLLNPKFMNNPFRYLLSIGGTSEEPLPPKPSIIEESDIGPQYTPQEPDRTPAGNVNSFYYQRLTASRQKAYAEVLDAVQNFRSEVELAGFNIDEAMELTDAVAFDHPELFYWVRRTLTMRGNVLDLCYGVSAEEAELLRRRIDEVASKYLEGITDTMSAYDVALRLHLRLIAMVDYDSIALAEEDRRGGPAEDKIDNLRTICGVFLDKKAVCEGYARALQYLLQKCGIECAEAAGFLRRENGEKDGGHAWNIVKIDGDYYYMDPTWDDKSNTVQTVKSTDPGFNYFCITTQELLRTRDLSMCPAAMPDCTAVRANYYYHNSLVLEKYDADQIVQIAKKAAEEHHKFFTFKFKSKSEFDIAHQKICVEGEDCFEALRAAAKVDKNIQSSTYSYSRDRNIYTITVIFKYK